MRFDDLNDSSHPVDISGYGHNATFKGLTLFDSIISDGTDDYIDTGVIPNENTTLEVVGRFVTQSSVNYMGSNNGTNVKVYFGDSSGKWRAGFGQNYSNGLDNSDTLRHNFKINSTGFFIDGSLEVAFPTITFGSSTGTMWLLGMSHATTPTYSNFQLESALIYDNTTLLRNYTTLSNGCLKDTLNDVQYCNNGTGDLVYSPNSYSGTSVYGNSAHLISGDYINLTRTSTLNIPNNEMTLCTWFNQEEDDIDNWRGLVGK